MSNWIEDVLSECEHVETPRSWLYWSLMCCVSAAAGNNYFLSALKGALLVKPNIYVILLGESGLGKEFPISLAIELVQKADVTRVIAGRSSIQAIIKELANAITREKKGPIDDSRGFVANGELSTAIIKDPDALTVLTDLYDRKTKWDNLLKGDGREKLKNPYITALFGSSPSHFYDSVPQVNIEGGYIGRNLVAYEEKRYQDTDLFSDADLSVSDAIPGFPYDKYAEHLDTISRNGGRVVPSSEAKDYFNIWRKKWREEQPQDKTGFNNRVPVHVLKAAMCLNLADYKTNLVVSIEQIQESIEQVTALTYSSKRAVEGIGKDPMSAQTKMVLDELLRAENNTLMRRRLLTKGYGHYDGAILDKILSDLEEIGWIQKTKIVAGKNTDWEISLSGEQLKQYQQFKLRRAK